VRIFHEWFCEGLVYKLHKYDKQISLVGVTIEDVKAGDRLVFDPKTCFIKKYTIIVTTPNDLPCDHALRCPMANDVYCAECDDFQAEVEK